MNGTNNNGPPVWKKRVKEYLGYNTVVLAAYIGLAALAYIFSSNIGKVTYLSPPPQKHVAMAYYHPQNNDPVKTVFHYRL